ERLTRSAGAGRVTAFSVMLTMIALFGFSISNSFGLLCLWAVPYGLGAGAVDATLNNFVALHYSQRHMHWLHCFWGVGVSISPYIMGYCLGTAGGWQAGYLDVAIIQAGLAAILFCSLPLWKKAIAAPVVNDEPTCGEPAPPHLGVCRALQLPGVKAMLVGFFCYCALESSVGLWASSYLVLNRGIGVEAAARWASLFFLGITGGRFFSGLIANKFSDRTIVRSGVGLIALGLLAILLPVQLSLLPLSGLIIIGLGCAPVYPAIIHETPFNFGKENSSAVIGIQMAGAYLGATLMPPLFGFIANKFGIFLYPFWLLLILIVMVVALECKNRLVNKKGNNTLN
ncbi:MAG: MFS transporter, partial [Victivallaceae bacterium]